MLSLKFFRVKCLNGSDSRFSRCENDLQLSIAEGNKLEKGFLEKKKKHRDRDCTTAGERNALDSLPKRFSRPQPFTLAFILRVLTLTTTVLLGFNLAVQKLLRSVKLSSSLLSCEKLEEETLAAAILIAEPDGHNPQDNGCDSAVHPMAIKFV